VSSNPARAGRVLYEESCPKVFEKVIALIDLDI
jgi:hypothetical protein